MHLTILDFFFIPWPMMVSYVLSQSNRVQRRKTTFGARIRYVHMSILDMSIQTGFIQSKEITFIAVVPLSFMVTFFVISQSIFCISCKVTHITWEYFFIRARMPSLFEIFCVTRSFSKSLTGIFVSWNTSIYLGFGISDTLPNLFWNFDTLLQSI